MAPKFETDRHAENACDRKRSHHRAQGFAPTFNGHRVGHDGEADGRRRTAARARNDPREKKRAEARREPRRDRAQHETHHGHRECAAAIEPVEEARGCNSSHRSRRRVRTRHEAEARRIDPELARVVGPERQDDHEVEDVHELREADEEDDFALRDAAVQRSNHGRSMLHRSAAVQRQSARVSRGCARQRFAIVSCA